jgi:Undecaprenyl-phosphate glucose phosphotransferase
MDDVIRGTVLPHPQQPAISAAESGSIARGSRATGADSDRHAISRRRATSAIEFISATVAAIDFFTVLITAASIFFAYFWLTDRTASPPSLYLATALIAAVAFVGVFERVGGYPLKRLQELRWQIPRITLAWLGAVAILLLIGFVARISDNYSRGWTLLWFLASPMALIVVRSVEHAVLARRLNDGSLARNVVIVGAGEEGQGLVATLRKSEDKSFRILGLFDDRRARHPVQVQDLPVLGTTDDLLNFARRERIDEVVVALPLAAEDRLKAIFEKLTVIPSDLRLSMDAIAERLPIRGVGYLAEAPVLEVVERPLKHGRGLCKWLEDKLIAVLILAFAGPLLMLIAILIKLDSRGPVFFVQPRFGFNNNVIRVLKFRTMYEDKCDHSGEQRTIQHDPRVTRIGRILRSLSLDELPQLINVALGDMSLVGPRPHAIGMKAGDRLYHQAVAKYSHRHRVKPGITGWAQVNGFRGEVDTLEKACGRVEHDLYYIANWSLWLDAKILLMTVGILISRNDAY